MPAQERQQRPPLTSQRFAKAQLTLVEHALCPLDASVSLTPNFVHETRYRYTDGSRNRRTATVKIGGLDGLSAHDEFYLWGLLALALSQPEPTADFYATPYYCLRRLGLITSERKGGREFELFRAAIKRLAGIRYQNDHFYDPVRGEHRAVSFGFLNYSLPLDAHSSRAWRFAWDPIFFELAQATGGALTFDLGLYREFDAATRRLYLLLKKLFFRSDTTPALDVSQLAVSVLGFSPTIPVRQLKPKIARCVEELSTRQIVALPVGSDALFSKQGRGSYTLRLQKGPAFDRITTTKKPSATDSPLFEPLQAIGLEAATIARLLKQYPAKLIEQWADITLAARDRHGEKFFKVSPQAFFMDNVKAAVLNGRTPPDWWHELRKQERQQERDRERSKQQLLQTADEAFKAYLDTEARSAFSDVMQGLVADLERAGRSPADAQDQGEHLARMHFWNRFRQKHPEWKDGHAQRVGDWFVTQA
jgi:hypothetical protein